MRIIAGEYKGRRLETPRDYDIRPTTDKVKEAMFSIVAPNLPDSVCVDLFSGTGNLGIEALSRGAKTCYFCDNSRNSIGLINRNLRHCQAEEEAIVYSGDFRRNLEKINQKVDIFFVDPPYEAGFYLDIFEKIHELDLLADDGIIVAEHRKREELPETVAGFEKIKERRYGQVVLSIYG